MNGKALVVRGYFDITCADGDHCGVARRVGVDTVIARAQEGDRAVGSVNLPGFAIIEMTYVQAQTAGVHAGLDDVVAQVHDLKVGARVQTDGILPDPQHGPRTAIGVQIVAGSHRVIWRCVGPLIHAGGLE